MEDGNFKNEASIRASKAISDKCDIGYVMTRVNEKIWNEVVQSLRPAVREGLIDPKYLDDFDYKPTHIIDIYKMRRGRYKNVRIWINLNLGTGRRVDLFMTTADNYPINGTIGLSSSIIEKEIDNWREELNCD